MLTGRTLAIVEKGLATKWVFLSHGNLLQTGNGSASPALCRTLVPHSHLGHRLGWCSFCGLSGLPVSQPEFYFLLSAYAIGLSSEGSCAPGLQYLALGATWKHRGERQSSPALSGNVPQASG